MEVIPILGASIIIFLILSILFCLVKEFGSQCKKKYRIDPTRSRTTSSSSSSPSFLSSDDVERQSLATISSGSSVDSAIILKQTLYSEIPVTVKPLGPPRTVEIVGVLSSQRVLTEEEKQEEFMNQVRRAQDTMKTANPDILKCKLVIGVDSCPSVPAYRIGGYCINLVTNSCQMYTYRTVVMPWQIKNEDDPGVEVAMKNLIFALMLWEEEIVKARKIRIYMGCASAQSKKPEDSKYIAKALGLIMHYQKCKKVTVINQDDMYFEGQSQLQGEDSQVTQEDFVNYARFIQPAKDLAEKRVKICERFFINFYPIDESKILKTHRQMKWNKVKRRPWYETTHSYADFLEKLRTNLPKWETPCPKCGFSNTDG